MAAKLIEMGVEKNQEEVKQSDNGIR